ncbi:emopamil-binding family protein [Spirillospora sp. NPDC029432]|uniref:EXPERA domain-containing protein n=1 Tax=Spirillospora sp. NPDC029432 TaxID=3154599 RepID=UPI003451F197
MAAHGGRRLCAADRLTITMVAFFMVIAFTIELYFIVHHRDIRQRTDLFAQIYELYGRGDESYYGRGYVALPLAFTTLNVFVTQTLNALLIWAIARRRHYRHPLQLAVSAYMSAFVILYLWTAHVSGYQGMAEKTFWGYVIVYAPQLPWLAGYMFLAWRSFTVIVQNSRAAGRDVG